MTKQKRLIIIVIAILFVVNSIFLYYGYRHKQLELSARKQLNTAMQFWDNSRLSDANQLFQQIVSNYADTAAATEAINAHQTRLQKYKQAFTKQHVNQFNNAFSQRVGEQIEQYHQVNHVYPDKLSLLKIFQQPEYQQYLDDCTYKKSLFNVAYSLDCQQADEEIVKNLMQQAIRQWEKGEFLTADKLFKQIAAEYPNTQTTATAAETHRAKIETYKQTITQQNALHSPRVGRVTQRVRKQLAKFYHNTGSYPQQLNELGLFRSEPFSKYLKGCQYEQALFNAGYHLDCDQADQYLHIDVGPTTNMATAAMPVKSSQRNEPASKSMGNLFNPEKKTPESGFMAYYFDVEEPENIIFKEIVKDIALSYSSDEFHGIKADVFGAYWAGEINVETPTFKQLNIAKDHLQARVIIDGKIVYNSGSSEPISPIITFSAGKHFVEVELINRWHSADFFVSFSDIITPLSEDEIRYYFTKNQESLGDYDVFYAGVYRSGADDFILPLNILKNERPIVLVLSSYSFVKWLINNPYQVDIKAIIYASHEVGSEVMGASSNTKLLPAEKQIGDYKLKSRCQCQASGKLSCDTVISPVIKQLTGQKLGGLAGDYNPEYLNIPTHILDERFQYITEFYDKKFNRQREACQKNATDKPGKSLGGKDNQLKNNAILNKILQSRLANALNLIALYKAIGSGWGESF